MLSLHTNAASLSTQNSLSGTHKALSTSQTRLGTGFRVNSAMDDAAGLQIATRLNAQSRGMAVAQRNTQNGISMLQTAEGALSEVSNIVLRMKDLATQSADAVSSTADRQAMQSEYDSLGLELKNIVENTSFGGQKLLNPTGGTLAAEVTFQIGSSADETMEVDLIDELGDDTKGLIKALKDVSASYKGTATADATTGLFADISTSTGANTMIGTLSTAIDKLGGLRASLGASANRLDHVYNNLSNMRSNTEQAKGRIMDVDYATESANMTSKQMLMQAGTSMLKQSSSLSQLTLSLLQ